MKHDLGRYVPQRMVEALAAGWRPRPGAEAKRLDAVAMVVDIAGSSALAERFALAGPSGAEELSVILDRYFGCMADIAIAHGGDVVDFVGDAIVVAWKAATEPTATLTLAAQCGHALQAAVPQLCAASGTELAQRVGIAAGPLLELELGGLEGKWHCLIAGTPLREAALACQKAAPGEVVATPQAWAALAARCSGEVLAAGGARVDRIHAPQPLPPDAGSGRTVPEDALAAYLPQPLVERLRAGGSRWVGEFREVTTLFIGLPQLHLAEGGAVEALQFATQCVQRVHRRYGGSLIGPSMDDKGVSLLSAFGLPMTAHEDDAERAVQAALALGAELAERKLDWAIGMTTGRVFYGDIGSSRRRHVAMMGVPVNTAAALMVAARSGVLCDDATRRAAEHVFEFEAQAAVTTKGRAEPLEVWRPRTRREQAPRRFSGALIGRAAERRRLDERIESLVRRTGGFVLLHGEAGIGKSRLLAHVAAEAGARGIRVLTCTGTAIESGTPYFPWRHLVAQLLGGDSAFNAARARTAVRRMLAAEEQLLDWLPLLNDLAPLGFADTALSRQITGAARASSLQALLRALIERSAATAPLLVVVDDLHWFDGASAAALSTAAHGLPGVLLLGATRPLEAAAPAELNELVQHGDALRIELDALSRAGVELLVCEKLAATTVPHEIVDFVHARTGGNPFYVEELILAVRAANLIEVESAVVRLAPGIAAGALQALPKSLRAVIVSRVDALGALEQLSLKVAAVIGREFSLPMVRELHPQAGAADLEGVLRTLLREDIVRRAPPTGRGDYAFKHAILQDVVYDQLPFSLRRELHGAAAAWIERREAGHLEPYYAELALHWERAENAQKAIEYLGKAAQFALGRYANREALRHLRRTIELAARAGLPMDHTRAARLEALLGEAHHGLFEYAAAVKHFKRALALGGRAVPERAASRVLAICREIGAQAAARTRLRGRATADRRAALQWSSQIYERLAEIAYFDNRPADLLHATLASLNLAERAGAVRETVEGYAALSIGLQQARAPKLAGYYNRRSIDVAESAGALGDIGYAHLVNCVFQATQGGWPDLARSHARAVEIYRQLGAGVRWHQACSVFYTSLMIRGLLEEGRRELEQVGATLTDDTPAPVRSWVSAAGMVLALERGLPFDELARELEALLDADLHRADRLQCLGLAAHGHLKQGRLDQALRRANEALALLEDAAPTAWHLLPGLAGTAEVFLAVAAADPASARASENATRACRLLQRYSLSTPICKPRAAVLAGRDAWRRGHAREAHALWRFAEKRAEALEMPRDRAAASLELAQCEVSKGLSRTVL